MNDDKALLEAAAKAVGMEGGYCDFMEAFQRRPGKMTPDGEAFSFWNPLQDDSDALKLVVRLCLTVKVEGHECEVFSNDGECLSSVPIMGASCYLHPAEATNPYAATRRAIVRAAASLGQEAK